MRAAHISLGQFSADARVQRTITSKSFESMCMGLPFVSGESRSMRELFTENDHCVYVQCDDARALAQKILTLRNNPTQLERMKIQSRHLYERELTPDAIADSVDSAIRDLIG